MLSLHKRVFPEKYDPMMVSTHYCLIKEGFVVDNVPDDDNEVLPLDKRTSLHLKVGYRKDSINIQATYALDQRYYFITLTINEKPPNTFLSIASYVNDGMLFDDENLINVLNEFIKASLNDFETCQDGNTGKDGNADKGGNAVPDVDVARRLKRIINEQQLIILRSRCASIMNQCIPQYINHDIRVQMQHKS
ncbi:unnamed protein product [Rotaria sordida]|uniref:Uncharacterized protein n=1 Tax=Rotaria sordida TaxID=392033 RepID=A0A819UT10_9BILA|nr:unnamed protein product [Rotaria sordida]